MSTSIIKSLLQRQLPKKKIRYLLAFLRQYVEFDDKKFNAKFDGAINTLTGNKKTMGIIEMVLEQEKKEAVEETRTEFVKNLLAARKFTIAEIAGFSGVTEAFVRKTKKSLK